MRILVRSVPGRLPMLPGRTGIGIGPTPRPIRFVPHPARIEQRQPEHRHRRRAPPQAHYHSAEILATKIGGHLSPRKSQESPRLLLFFNIDYDLHIFLMRKMIFEQGSIN